MERQARGITTRLIIEYVRKAGGQGAVRELIAQTSDGLDETYFLDERGWVSFEQKNRMFEAAKRILGDPRAAYRIGQSIAYQDAGSAVEMSLRMLKSPSNLLRQIPQVARSFGSMSTIEILKCNSNEGILRYSLDPSITPDQSDCEYNRGLLSAIPMLFGQGPAKVEHRVCAARGEAPYCEYKVSWRTGIRADWLLTALGIAAGLITYAISDYPGQLQMDLGLLLQPVLGAGTGFMIGRFLQDRKRKNESTEMMRKQNALLMKANEQFISDLETAYQVQRTLLPSHNPEIKGLDVAGRLFYARRIGGDFYDFIPKREQLGVCIADVCGKGVQAALFTSVLKNALWQGMYTSNRPKKLLAYVDHQVNRQLPDEMFITMGCAVVDTSRDKIVIGSAGHEPPILYKAGDRKASLLGINGLALGLRHLASLDPDMQDEEEHEFTEGDVMMFYTDGALVHVSDQDAAREELARLLETKVHLPAEEIVNQIFSDLMEHSSASKRDDLTIVVVKRTGKEK